MTTIRLGTFGKFELMSKRKRALRLPEIATIGLVDSPQVDSAMNQSDGVLLPV